MIKAINMLLKTSKLHKSMNHEEWATHHLRVTINKIFRREWSRDQVQFTLIDSCCKYDSTGDTRLTTLVPLVPWTLLGAAVLCSRPLRGPPPSFDSEKPQLHQISRVLYRLSFSQLHTQSVSVGAIIKLIKTRLQYIDIPHSLNVNLNL